MAAKSLRNFEHATATKSMASSSRPIQAFFNGSIPSSIKKMMQRRRARTRVVSSRIARMMQSKDEYGSATEFEIEASKVHWSALNPMTTDEEEGGFETNLETFQSLRERWGDFFKDFGDDELVIGEKIAEGGQAEIFNAGVTWSNDRKEECVVKVFKEGWALRDLEKQWPQGMLRKIDSGGHEGMLGKSDGAGYYSSNSCQIYGGTLLKNGRFAFLMQRYERGDLRKIIDYRMQEFGNQSPPFSDQDVRRILLSIAWGMWALHEHNIIHRDLKASNVLVTKRLDCVVADFECSVGVVGTTYWRAPEILQGVQNSDIKSRLFTKKSDVYSYAMTCYEVLTGCIPFEDLDGNCYDVVIAGKRPKLPKRFFSHDLQIVCQITPVYKRLLERCWHANPLERPSFKDIVEQLKDTRQMGFAYVSSQ